MQTISNSFKLTLNRTVHSFDKSLVNGIFSFSTTFILKALQIDLSSNCPQFIFLDDLTRDMFYSNTMYNRGRVIKQTNFSLIVSLDEKLPCPEDIFVEIHQSQSEAEVTLPDLVTYDDVEVTPEWARSKEGFPVGSTTVTIQTRPGSLYNDSCSFSVHVLGKWRSPAELMVYRIVALF